MLVWLHLTAHFHSSLRGHHCFNPSLRAVKTKPGQHKGGLVVDIRRRSRNVKYMHINRKLLDSEGNKIMIDGRTQDQIMGSNTVHCVEMFKRIEVGYSRKSINGDDKIVKCSNH